MDRVTDKLYIGNIKAASDMNTLKSRGITHILQVADGFEPFFPKVSQILQ